jgi:hypothetical protein
MPSCRRAAPNVIPSVKATHATKSPCRLQDEHHHLPSAGQTTRQAPDRELCQGQGPIYVPFRRAVSGPTVIVMAASRRSSGAAGWPFSSCGREAPASLRSCSRARSRAAGSPLASIVV